MAKTNHITSDQIAGNVLGCLFILVWGLIAGFIALLVKLVRALLPKPEAELRQLGPSSHWGAIIEAVPCPVCATPNESGTRICQFCGRSLSN